MICQKIPHVFLVTVFRYVSRTAQTLTQLVDAVPVVSCRLRHGLGTNHVAPDGGGAAPGGPGRGLGAVRGGQLADGLRSDALLHYPGRQVRPVRAVPVLHRGVCVLPALHGRARPRDAGAHAGGD